MISKGHRNLLLVSSEAFLLYQIRNDFVYVVLFPLYIFHCHFIPLFSYPRFLQSQKDVAYYALSKAELIKLNKLKCISGWPIIVLRDHHAGIVPINFIIK